MGNGNYRTELKIILNYDLYLIVSVYDQKNHYFLNTLTYTFGLVSAICYKKLYIILFTLQM